jgi:hypothetical protein
VCRSNLEDNAAALEAMGIEIIDLNESHKKLKTTSDRKFENIDVDGD